MKKWAFLGVFGLLAGLVFSAASAEVRLFAMECGRGTAHQLGIFADSGVYDGQERKLVVSCFLIRHPKGDLIWDTGMPDSLATNPEGRVSAAFTFTVPKTLESQIAALGLTPGDIEFLALSHSHLDHSGNANMFAASTWLSDPRERAWMFGEAAADNPSTAANYNALKQAETIDVIGRYDVFGDDSVVLIPTPGHTPGHLSLLVRLAHSGPVLLTGDLFHFRESLERDLVPRFNVDRAQTVASMAKFKDLAARLSARIIVQHDLGDFAALPQFPEYLD